MNVYRNAVIDAESQQQEHGYTVGEFNRQAHASVEGNSHLDEVRSGHLEFVQGKGVRKVQERDCLRCLDTGLNDGRFHALPLVTGKGKRDGRDETIQMCVLCTTAF